MSPKGNPPLKVRLDPEITEKLREISGEAAGGVPGGMSLFVRRLIYRELGVRLPPPGAMSVLFVMAERAESGPLSEDEVRWLKDLCITEPDIIRRNFALQILGKLSL